MNRKLFNSAYTNQFAMTMAASAVPFFYCGLNGFVTLGVVLVACAMAVPLVLGWIMFDEAEELDTNVYGPVLYVPTRRYEDSEDRFPSPNNADPTRPTALDGEW